MSANTVAEVMRVGAEMYERIELRVACDIKSINLTGHEPFTRADSTQFLTTYIPYHLFKSCYVHNLLVLL